MRYFDNPLTDRVDAVLAAGGEMTAPEIRAALGMKGPGVSNAVAHLELTKRVERCGEVSRGGLNVSPLYRIRRDAA